MFLFSSRLYFLLLTYYLTPPLKNGLFYDHPFLSGKKKYCVTFDSFLSLWMVQNVSRPTTFLLCKLNHVLSSFFTDIFEITIYVFVTSLLGHRNLFFGGFLDPTINPLLSRSLIIFCSASFSLLFTSHSKLFAHR